MDFEALNPTTLAAYLNQVPAVSALLGQTDQLDIVEVGDGNLNFVYFVSSRSGPEKSIVVKQALPYVRLVGEGWPLTRHRADREAAALRRFGELCPQHVPSVYHADSAQSLIVMQHLSAHVILRKGLIGGHIYPDMAQHLSTYLARTLFFGSDLFLNPEDKRQAMCAAINSELCKITEDLIFTYPFDGHESNVLNPALPGSLIDDLQRNQALRTAAAEMKWAFMNQAECLLHGDLHTGSVMVNQQETYIIDPEFAFYGPMGFDVGLLLANLLMASFSQDWHRRSASQEHDSYQDWILLQVEALWNGFSDQFIQLWQQHEADTASPFMGRDPDGLCAQAYRRNFMQKIFRDSLGFAGCEMVRRTVGLAKVADIAGIPDDQARARIEVRCLQLAQTLLLQRNQIRNISEVVHMARQQLATGADHA
jgi:5-methylthioribose kinase